ncbi:MAG: tetraacyldisaccharide 4'-kinase [Acidobacteria bacterium]|nr:tetraacyldisaccharide 4'-kinase [Acidobacteriota bacterium]MCI0567040.1 tetraacyldisaccharide 4'-kinase [Acidobacteriota bacterium]
MDSPTPLWLCALLFPAGLLYRGGVGVRNLLYERGSLPILRLPIPVASVGNLTVGGSGKTPFVAYLANRLRESGRRVAVASRGYGGSPHPTPLVVSDGAGPLISAAEAGDEPVLLSQLLPSVVVIVCRDRWTAGRLARERFGSDLILLDDGYQHRRLARDLDLLLVDAEGGFGNGRMLPCGPLREPLRELARCDALVITGSAEQLQEGARRAREMLTDLALARPVFRCERRADGFARLDSDERLSPTALQGMKAVAFSGIAHPAAFESDLRALGVNVVDSVRFRDHQKLGSRELARVAESAKQFRPDFLVTTEKDRARLGALRLPAPAYALRIRMAPLEEDELMALVTRRLSSNDSAIRTESP